MKAEAERGIKSRYKGKAGRAESVLSRPIGLFRQRVDRSNVPMNVLST